MPNINIHNADVIEFLKTYSGEKFHAVISDPPYGLAFMGKAWDKYTPKQYQEWVTQWASLLLNHLYPGSVCMFFGGTRTYHRLATGLEDAGFEIFDSMMWCYGSGFPKSYNISKGIDNKFGLEREIVGKRNDGRYAYDFQETNNQMGQLNPKISNVKNIGLIDKPNSLEAVQWNGYGTALKPAFEPIVLCRKPRGKETFVDCALNYGTGSLNVDGTRIGNEMLFNNPSQNHNTTNLHNYGLSPNGQTNVAIGRFPANLGLICDCEKEPCECDYQTIGDSARFFYTAKSSRKERNLGLDHLPDLIGGGLQGTEDLSMLTGSGNVRNNVMKNNHPTVKPIKLIEYLATMLKPPIDDSSILIPFSGSGSEIIGAMFAGWNVINAIEIDENYCNIAQNRVDYWKQFSTYADGLKG